MPRISRVNPLAAWAAVLLLQSPAALADAGASCPVVSSPAAVATLAAAAARPVRHGDGISVGSESTGPYDPQAAAERREAERSTFERILTERPTGTSAPTPVAPITPRQIEAIEREADRGRLRVGTALAIGRDVDFARLGAVPAVQEVAFANGLLRAGPAATIWETEIVSEHASALRLHFHGVDLGPDVELYVYNEAGRVVGPYAGSGPDGGGDFWSEAVFGDRVRLHLRAPDAAALRAARFELARAMHFGSRYRIAEAEAQRYVIGPEPNGGGFCGVTVPTCTVDGMCALETNPGLENATKGIAHLQFADGDDAFICTGTLLNTAFEGPDTPASTAAGRPPYLLTANHCIDNQASAASLQAYFHYRTTSCTDTGNCSFDLVQVSGSTLLTTGAAPAQPDFTLLRLSPLPVGAGLMRLGWTTETVGEGWYLMHLGHPDGAPLAYSYRRSRLNNTSLPHCTDAPEPTFLYSGLSLPASNPPDAVGAVSSGSSGSAALSFLDDFSDVQVVGQLFGHCPSGGDVCDANADSTIDGSFRAAYPFLQRFLVERIYANGFD
jgi:hypothetical protein